MAASRIPPVKEILVDVELYIGARQVNWQMFCYRLWKKEIDRSGAHA
jgi:hypothetical protein